MSEPSPSRIIDLNAEEELALAADWAEQCHWDPLLPPDHRLVDAPTLIAAVAAAIERPQPLAWGPDPEVEEAAELFALAAGSVEVAIEQLICLRRAFLRRIGSGVPVADLLEVHERMHMVIDRAIGVAAQRTTSHLKAEAFTDPLTGLANRRALERNLRRELARAARHNRPFTVVVIDLDGLKQINDGQGHAAGDRALRWLAGSLTAAIRDIDSAHRIGGDEFVIVLPETAPDVAAGIVERVRAGAPAFSWGTAGFPHDGASAAELLERADQRLYEQRDRRRAGAGASPPRSAT